MRNIHNGALDVQPYRVIVSTDIGGSDPDDYQSLVHYLLYSDVFDTEGLISSPWEKGTVDDIYEVIDQYEADYSHLVSYSPNYPTPDYPTPDYLRSITKQGVIEIAPFKGYRQPTEGSEWIIECAHKQDSRPLYILVWGLLEDVAQALHDAPSIANKLRVYYIAGPNKKWGLNAYEYIRRNFPDLWMIENNSTYRGWFVGGDQSEDLGNKSFVQTHVKGHGQLGNYFEQHLGGIIKMGDTPSVAYLLTGNPERPESESWGGSFIPVYNRPKSVFRRNTGIEDKVEVFGVMEFVFKGPEIDVDPDTSVFSLLVKGDEFEGFYCGNGEYRVRFMPKSTGEWSYTIKSEIQVLDGQSGAFTCVEETAEGRIAQDAIYPRWWSDRLDKSNQEQAHKGAKTVNKWRANFLEDFKLRMDRCKGKSK